MIAVLSHWALGDLPCSMIVAPDIDGSPKARHPIAEGKQVDLSATSSHST